MGALTRRRLVSSRASGAPKRFGVLADDSLDRFLHGHGRARRGERVPRLLDRRVDPVRPAGYGVRYLLSPAYPLARWEAKE
jgi:hypothetical protein